MRIKKFTLSLFFRLFFIAMVIIISMYFSINISSCSYRTRVIKIGNQAVLSGENKSFGEDQLVSINLAADKLSPVRIGGFDYKINVITKDDEGNPEKAFLVAQELINEEVSCVIGSTFSGTTEASIPVYNEFEIPMIAPSAHKTELSKMGDYFFRLVMSNAQKVENIAGFIKDEINPQKIILINNREEYSINLIDYLKEILFNYGIETPEPMSVEIGEEDITHIAEYLLLEGPDAIFFSGDFSELAAIIAEGRRIGLGSIFITEMPEVDDSIFALNEAQDFEGLIAIIPEPPSLASYSQDSKAVSFWYDFNDYLNEPDDLDVDIEGPGQYAPYCYDSVFVIIEAMKKANSIVPVDYIDELQDTSYDGVVGHIEFDSNGDRVEPKSTGFIVRDGAWVRY